MVLVKDHEAFDILLMTSRNVLGVASGPRRRRHRPGKEISRSLSGELYNVFRVGPLTVKELVVA